MPTVVARGGQVPLPPELGRQKEEPLTLSGEVGPSKICTLAGGRAEQALPTNPSEAKRKTGSGRALPGGAMVLPLAPSLSEIRPSEARLYGNTR